MGIHWLFSWLRKDELVMHHPTIGHVGIGADLLLVGVCLNHFMVLIGGLHVIFYVLRLRRLHGGSLGYTQQLLIWNMVDQLANLVHNHLALRVSELVCNLIIWNNNFEVVDKLRVK